MKMSHMILAGCLIGLLAGCRTPTMKGTPFYVGEERKTVGEVSDRVNLWPLAYWDDPMGSIAWPIVSFSDDQFAIRPLYSQYRQNGAGGRYDEFNLLWPFIQADLDGAIYRIFPLFFAEDFQCLFPVYWNFDDYNVLFPLWHYKGRMFGDEISESDWKLYTLGGLAGIQHVGSKFHASWLFPLWYEDSDGRFITPVYGKTSNAHWTFPFYYADDSGLLVTPFYGRKDDTYWILPLCYQDSNTFVSSFYMHGDKGTTTWWAIPSLLAWGSTGYEGMEAVRSDGKILLGIGSWSFERRERTWSLFPLIRQTFGQRYSTTRLGWILSGWACSDGNVEYAYLLPVFLWKDSGSFVSPLLGWGKQEEVWTDAYLLPLFVWTRGQSLMTPLFGWGPTWRYATPLFMWGQTWRYATPLFMWGSTWCCMTPFLGWRTGTDKGGWLFPIWNYRESRTFDETCARLDWEAQRLPEWITVDREVVTNRAGVVSTQLTGNAFNVQSRTDWLLFSDNFHTIGGGMHGDPTNRLYTISSHRKIGNRLGANYDAKRTATYNPATREKVSDVDEVSSSLLIWLYQYNCTEDRMAKNIRTRRCRSLWKLWDWNEREGAVSFDVFPGFTYDAQSNGASQASFLWRFFRYAHDPANGTSIDVFFLPVWRP